MALLGSVKDDFLAALLARDATRARHLVDVAVGDGMGVEEAYLELLAPALVEVGDLWARGEAGVAHEHFATAVTQGVVGALGPRIRRPPEGGRLGVLACVPGEQHAVGVQMVGDLLEAASWEVLLLGAGLPAADLAELVASEQPDVVGLSMATVGLLPAARACVAALAELEPRPFVVLGGRGWEDVTAAELEAVGADACVPDPRDFVALVAERFPPLPGDGL